VTARSEALLSRAAQVEQTALLGTLRRLEEAEAAAGPVGLPRDAERLRAALWPFLQAYGRRDHRGVVDERERPPLVPWTPGSDG
jgi:hypothetical protein